MRHIVTDVAWSVCLSVFVTTVSATNTAEPFEVQFVAWTRIGPRNHGPTSPGERGISGWTMDISRLLCGIQGRPKNGPTDS